ncbi:MAG: SPOR domain-containing protein, partial [Candidatus Thiodiazotropha sp. (ex Epidulcina cf. delphinae)]|nr:SPOR domain-containing protein [Candidatus Thiodiazotropha sp. (ex Epidulcina cf. delphinae)]
GGAVLVALMVIFVPMLIEKPMDQQIVSDHTIPPEPRTPERSPAKRVSVEKARSPRSRAMPLEVKPAPEPVSKPEPVSSQPPKRKNKASAAADRSAPTAWMIQVASLTNGKNAEKLVANLQKADLPAQVERIKLGGKLYYRVRVGPEVDHRLAERMLDKIEKMFKLHPKLMRYPE